MVPGWQLCGLLEVLWMLIINSASPSIHYATIIARILVLGSFQKLRGPYGGVLRIRVPQFWVYCRAPKYLESPKCPVLYAVYHVPYTPYNIYYTYMLTIWSC